MEQTKSADVCSPNSRERSSLSVDLIDRLGCRLPMTCACPCRRIKSSKVSVIVNASISVTRPKKQLVRRVRPSSIVTPHFLTVAVAARSQGDRVFRVLRSRFEHTRHCSCHLIYFHSVRCTHSSSLVVCTLRKQQAYVSTLFSLLHC